MREQLIIALTTLAASFGGYLLAGYNDRRRDERAARHERQRQRDERRLAAESEMRAFQRQTLMSLLDALQVMSRIAGKTLHFDHMQAREGLRTNLPDGYSDDAYANGVLVRRLQIMILDPQVRAAVSAFNEAVTRATMLSGYSDLSPDAVELESLHKLDGMNDAWLEVSRVVGEALRSELVWTPEATSQGQLP